MAGGRIREAGNRAFGDRLDFNPSLEVDFNLAFNPFLTMRGIMHPDLFEPVSPSIKQDERVLTGSL